jgi:hypothetical protein
MKHHGLEGRRSARESAKVRPMTREKALALYRPIRASLRSILKEAVGVCN